MKAMVLITVFGFIFGAVGAQTNVPLLHQLVGDSKKEHSFQSEARNSQAKANAQEEINRGLLEKVKLRYRDIHERFQKITTLIDAVGIGNTALPIVESILENQQNIVKHCKKDPSLVPLALETERGFVQRSKSLLNYLIGLSAVVGDLNQMKASDWRLLFRHVIDELSQISRTSRGVASSLVVNQPSGKGVNPFPSANDTDVRIMQDVLSNLKTMEK